MYFPNELWEIIKKYHNDDFEIIPLQIKKLNPLYGFSFERLIWKVPTGCGGIAIIWKDVPWFDIVGIRIPKQPQNECIKIDSNKCPIMIYEHWKFFVCKPADLDTDLDIIIRKWSTIDLELLLRCEPLKFPNFLGFI
jgi:hypothetical protein